jgi:hypothetical protein
VNHNSEAFSLSWLGLQRRPLGQSKILLLALGMLVLVLAVAAVVMVAPAIKGAESPATVSGIDADSARWQALGAYYAPDFEAASATSSARWQALAAEYAARYERSAAASSARYQALAEWYTSNAVAGK